MCIYCHIQAKTASRLYLMPNDKLLMFIDLWGHNWIGYFSVSLMTRKNKRSAHLNYRRHSFKSLWCHVNVLNWRGFKEKCSEKKKYNELL